MLVVPCHVMTPDELEALVSGMANDDAGDRVYSMHRGRLRYMSEWIAQAKQAVTKRSGFKFDPTVRAIRAQ